MATGKQLCTFLIQIYGLIDFFLSLSNETSKVCLTMDCSGTNPIAAAKFRAEVDNAMEQPRYFNVNSRDKLLQYFSV